MVLLTLYTDSSDHWKGPARWAGWRVEESSTVLAQTVLSAVVFWRAETNPIENK